MGRVPQTHMLRVAAFIAVMALLLMLATAALATAAIKVRKGERWGVERQMFYVPTR